MRSRSKGNWVFKKKNVKSFFFFKCKKKKELSLDKGEKKGKKKE